ncbi:MAG TPA: hypothetical protein PKC76_19495 [Saprospiraceae bacterium]|nr:hypothetical protein [Saprospiraceae bacterium]HMP26322.1 hypothetical protein [Saprospiraceae bacterium]
MSLLVYQTVSDDIENLKGKTFFEISEYVNNQQQYLANLLNSEEQKQYYSFLAVVKYSARLWLTEDYGGLNYIKYFNPEWGNGELNLRGNCFNEWKALLCDGIGAIAGGPTTAGAATLISIVNQWDCK